MEEKYFLVQVQRKNGIYSKGVVIHDSLDAARQGYHAYLGAYAYGHDATIDYVMCMVVSMRGSVLNNVVWDNIPKPEE